MESRTEMLIKRSPSGPPETISSSLVQFSEESLYYSLSLRTEAGKHFSVFWCSSVSTWSSSHSDSPLLVLAFSRSRTILSLRFPSSCIEY